MPWKVPNGAVQLIILPVFHRNMGRENQTRHFGHPHHQPIPARIEQQNITDIMARKTLAHDFVPGGNDDGDKATKSECRRRHKRADDRGNNNNSSNSNINNNNVAKIKKFGSLNEETPSPTVGGSIEPLDDDAPPAHVAQVEYRTSMRSAGGNDTRSAGGCSSGGSAARRTFRTMPRGSPRPPVRAASQQQQQQTSYAKASDGTESSATVALLTRPERLLQQEMNRLKRQNSDPSPALKRRPKLEIMPPTSPNTSSLFDRPISPVYPHQIDEDLLKVPLRSGTSPSVVSFQSDPESCLDGLYPTKYGGGVSYGEDDDDYDEPFSIGGREKKH
ncbi:hypothetical protein niasHS_016255 [Heterodera schachtii]|uniref:Uncharacterized protein n=1 Tax=Heterodera schachtii TaxID=97005 RepID=A0ABD2HNQ9_HETSC